MKMNGNMLVAGPRSENAATSSARAVPSAGCRGGRGGGGGGNPNRWSAACRYIVIIQIFINHMRTTYMLVAGPRSENAATSSARAVPSAGCKEDRQ